MSQDRDRGPRLYKARRPDGEVAWVDHDELWRLQQGQSEELRRGQLRRRRAVLLAVVGLAALALGLLAWRLWPAGGPAAAAAAEEGRPEPRDVPMAQKAGEPVAAEAGDLVALVAPEAPEAPAAGAAVPPPLAARGGAGGGDTAPGVAALAARPASPAGPPLVLEERVAAAVRRWADAWSRQDVTAYLDSYAAAFEPTAGLERPDWERLRRERLVGPSSIRVEIERLEVVPGEAGRAEARFLQTYRSPAYSDVVRKRLLLVDEAGEWKIASELAEAPRAAP